MTIKNINNLYIHLSNGLLTEQFIHVGSSIAVHSNYNHDNCESNLFEMINELLLIKLITANENNFSLQLNFKGLN